MVLLGTFVKERAPWPAVAVVLGMNAAVHVPLYTYYLLSALGPEWRPGKKWKIRLTTVQMTQFVLGMAHGLVGWLHYNFCIYAFLYGALMLGMFADFFVKTYIRGIRSQNCEGGEVRRKTQ